MRLVHDHMSNGPLGSKYVFHLDEGFINKNYFVAGNDFLMNKSIINHHLVTSVSFFLNFVICISTLIDGHILINNVPK